MSAYAESTEEKGRQTVERRGADVLLEVLRSEGAEYIFGNPGTTELPLIDALVRNESIHYVLGLQEATAVSIADGYAQGSGKPAVVNLHTSGGLGHGMGAIMNAKIGRVPMVVTAGQQDLRHFLADPLLAADLVGMAGPVAKWSFEPNSLEDIPLIIRRAFHDSMAAPRGPVFISLPMNLLDEVGSPPILAPSRIERATTGGSIQELATELLAYEPGKVVIVAGNDIAEPGVDAAIARVARAIGGRVYGSSWPSINPYPSIDAFWRGFLPTTAKATSEILENFDCLLGLGGKSLVAIVYTARDPIPANMAFYHVSESAMDIGHNDAPKMGIVGNVCRTLEALAGTLEDRVKPEQIERNVAAAKTERDRLDRQLADRASTARDLPGIEPIVSIQEIMRSLPDGLPVVDEAPSTMAFSRSFHRTTGTRQFFNNRGGALGWGMPAAIGVSLARDKGPVVCLVGDGSALYSPQALWTAAHEETPVVYIVLNNQEYGILKNFMLNQPQYNARKHGFLAMDIVDPRIDYLSMAKSMGVEATRIEQSSEISGAVEAALKTGKTSLIEVPITTGRSAQ